MKNHHYNTQTNHIHPIEMESKLEITFKLMSYYVYYSLFVFNLWRQEL
jgi:hypothetical protein